MKSIISFMILLLIISSSCDSQKQRQDTASASASASTSMISQKDLIGAWEAQETTDSGTVVSHIITFTDKYFSEAIYLTDPPTFMWTLGGSWKLDNGIVNRAFEYYSNDSTRVGTEDAIVIQQQGSKMLFSGLSWTKLDGGIPGELQGAWLITGRKREGKLNRRTPGERKTMKILSGTRFQWIAYHTGTGKFSGTGGGTYTTVDGKYTEHIQFFSRDNTRVGASLEFDYALDSGEWHHSGLSSKGTPIYEVWTPRSLLEN